MGGKKRTLRHLQEQAFSVSRAWWPVDARHCVATGKAAQSRRLLIMNGIYLTNIRVKRQRRCAYCQSVVEYRSYIKVVRHMRPASSSIFRQGFYLSIVTALLAAGISLCVLIIHHWSLVLLLALVWLAIAYSASRLLASDMKILRQGQKRIEEVSYGLRMWSSLLIRSIGLFFRRGTAASNRKKPVVAVPRAWTPTHFPETPMPATPLIRVLETIDLSSSNIEHFLEEEKQTSGEMPVVSEHQCEREMPVRE